MKKILMTVMIIAMCVTGGVAQAMRIETMDLTKRQFEITEGFYKPMLSGNLDWAQREYNSCLTAHAALYDYLNLYKPQTDKNGYVIEFLSGNDREVIYHAANIIVLRRNALYDYILALEAYKRNDTTGQNAMIEACTRDLQLANEYRQNFINLYGY